MRVRAAAAAALVVLTAAALAGCGLLVPQSTLKKYDPSDGVGADLGKVAIRNVLAIAGDTSRSTGDANLVMTAINTSDAAITLHIQYTSGGSRKDRSVSLAPGSNKVGYGSKGQLLLTGFHPKPGALASIYFQHGSEQGVQLRVPVLDDSWSSYSELGPTATPTPTASTTNPPVTPYPVPPAPTP